MEELQIKNMVGQECQKKLSLKQVRELFERARYRECFGWNVKLCDNLVNPNFETKTKLLYTFKFDTNRFISSPENINHCYYIIDNNIDCG